MIYRIFLIIVGTALCCPFVFASCDFEMKSFDYFHKTNAKLKVHVKVKQACADNDFVKRDLKSVTVNVFNDKKLHSSYDFDSGLWQEKQSRFLLNRKKPFDSGCFKGLTKVYFNLKDGFINSLSGTYWDLKTGKSLKLNCI